jgi:hypothetical protein
VDVTIGGNNPKVCEKGGCVEALLDIEYIEGVAHPIPLTVIYSDTCTLPLLCSLFISYAIRYVVALLMHSILCCTFGCISTEHFICIFASS